MTLVRQNSVPQAVCQTGPCPVIGVVILPVIYLHQSAHGNLPHDGV